MRCLALFLALLIPNLSYAECNFRTSDYAIEMFAPEAIKSINIEVPKSSKFARNQFKIIASNSTNIPDRLKKKFEAKITVYYNFGNCLYQGKVRQNGDLRDHITLINGNVVQSLDVKLKTGNILGAVRFKLLIPQTRNGINEVFATSILKNLGFLAPETFEVNTSINGVKAKMLFQERAEKELLERNRRREGPIFRGDEVLMWSYKNFTNTELDKLSLSTLYNKGWFKKGISSQKIIINSYGKMQNASLRARFHEDRGEQSYLIPDKASEQLYHDFMGVLIAMNGYHGLAPNNRKHYFNAISSKFEPIYYDGNVDLTRGIDPLDRKMFKPVILSDHLFEAIKQLDSNSIPKNDFLKRVINKEYAQSFFDVALSRFQRNILEIQAQSVSIEEFRKSVFTVDDSEYYSWFNGFQDSKRLNQKIITGVRVEEGAYLVTFDNYQVVALNEDEVLNILSSNLLHGERVVYIPLAANSSENTAVDFIDISVDEIKIRMSRGMSAKYDLINKKLAFHQTTLSDWALIYDSYLDGWAISLNGLVPDQAKPTLGQRFNAQGITGCLTIHNSELIDSSLSIVNGQCEDSLNLISTNGSKITIKIQNSYADAVDADFSFLDIDYLEVFNAGNDCFDVSGGKYYARISKLIGCGDKGISVGENSYFEAEEISVENALIGISAKDFSRAIVSRITMEGVLICGESKRKKQEFGGGQLFIGETNCGNSYSIDDESIAQIGK